MDKVVSLADFASARRPWKARPPLSDRQQGLSPADIHGRDYAGLRDAVYALLRVTELLDGQFGQDPAWQGPLLGLLREVHARAEGREHATAFRSRCRELEDYAVAGLCDANATAVGAAVTLLRLLGGGLQAQHM